MTAVQTSPNSNGISSAVSLRNTPAQDDEGSAEGSARPVTDSQSPPVSTVGPESSAGRSPKKRRKVNHGESVPADDDDDDGDDGNHSY